MSCRVCLCRNMQVYYKLNNNYIDLIETITEVKMKLNDLVCCFCLATLRKIEKFTKTVKEVDSILKHSINTKENGTANSHYNLVVSVNRNISIECSRALCETYNRNMRDVLLGQIERELVKIEEMEDEPRQLSEDAAVDNETESANDVPSITELVTKEEENECTGENDELHKMSEDTIVDNETDSKDDVPLITAPDVGSEYETPLNDSCQNETTNTNGGYILKDLKICLRRVDENIDLLERPREEHSGQQATVTKTNNESYNRKECQLNEKYGVDTISLNNKPFSCDVCAYRSRSKSVLSRHIRAHTEASKESNNTVVTANIKSCVEVKRNISQERGNKFDINDAPTNKRKAKSANGISKQNDVDPLSSRGKVFVCDMCGHRTKYKHMLAVHLRTHTGEKPYSCHICSYVSSGKGNVTLHLRTHTGKKPFLCNYCSYKCFSKCDLIKHLRTHIGEKPYSCHICSYVSSHKSHVTQHLSTHTGGKPYSCHICSYVSSRKCNVTKHLRTHTGEKPYSCHICSYVSSRKCNVTRHLRTHTGEKPYSCHICSYVSSHKSHVTQHLRTHTGEKPYSCDICSYVSSDKSSLTRHLRTHTGEKPYSCHVCSYVSSVKIRVTQHLRTHTGEKPFSCYICPRKYSRQSTLAVHLRKHLAEKSFSCNICSYKFYNKRYFALHLKRHSQERSFTCDICAHKTKSKRDLKDHVYSRHLL